MSDCPTCNIANENLIHICTVRSNVEIVRVIGEMVRGSIIWVPSGIKEGRRCIHISRESNIIYNINQTTIGMNSTLITYAIDLSGWVWSWWGAKKRLHRIDVVALAMTLPSHNHSLYDHDMWSGWRGWSRVKVLILVVIFTEMEGEEEPTSCCSTKTCSFNRRLVKSLMEMCLRRAAMGDAKEA